MHQAETVNSGSAEPDRVNTREGNKSNHSALVYHLTFGEKLAATSFLLLRTPDKQLSFDKPATHKTVIAVTMSGNCYVQ